MSDVHKRIQAVCKEYETHLEDLTFNSRVLIQNLTVIAEKNKVYAPHIVQIVEKRITKVPPEQKLPVLYLLDSIMKNLGGEYLQLFSKNIVATFCHTFEKVVDPKKRISLFKLRQTWNAIIPARKLIAIDKHVHSIDSGWPVMPESPSTPQSPKIFVNPKFVKPDGELATKKIEDDKKEKDKASVQEQTQSHKSSDESKQDGAVNIQEQRKALLEQQRQIRFEREKQMGIHTSEANVLSTDTPRKSAISGSKGIKGASSGPKRVRFIDEDQQTEPAVKKTKDENHLESSTNQGNSPSALHIRNDVLEQIAKEPVNMSDLLSKLVKTGLLPQQQPPGSLPQQQPPGSLPQQQPPGSLLQQQPPRSLPQQQPPGSLPQQQPPMLLPQQRPTDSIEATQQSTTVPPVNMPPVNSMDVHLPPAIRMNPTLRIPDLHLKKSAHLKQFYPSLVDLLYAGEQCSQCGLRFTEVASNEYRSHLDWHFQLNRKDKDGLRKTSRNWFLHPDDWHALKEGEQIEDKVKSNIFEQEQLEEEQKVEDGNISCKVLPGEGNEACHLCGETFEQFWEEDLEEWHFKDAVRAPDGLLYHGDCRKEAEVPQTPVTPTASDIIPKEEFEKARTKALTDVDR